MKGGKIISKEHCHDCKYSDGYKCTHKYSEDCKNCELWVPFWYGAHPTEKGGAKE